MSCSSVTSGVPVEAPTPQTGSEYFVSAERAEHFKLPFNDIATHIIQTIQEGRPGWFHAYRADKIKACPVASSVASTFHFGDDYEGVVFFCSETHDMVIRAKAQVKGGTITEIDGFALGTSAEGLVELLPNPAGFQAQFISLDEATVVRATKEMTVERIKAADQQVLDYLGRIRQSFAW